MELCCTSEIPLSGSRAINAHGHQLFVIVNEAGQPAVYVNRCPHLGVPLQWQDDRFLNKDGQYIICSTHGALFEKESGLCIHGPCRGQKLLKIPSRTEKGMVVISEEELEKTMAGLS